jgi:hypothetical protein
MVELRPLDPNEETLAKIADYLMYGFLAMSDEERTPERIADMVVWLFKSNRKDCIFIGVYKPGETVPGGFVGFLNITPGLNCDVMTKVWDKSIWGPDVIRSVREVIKSTMDEYDLYRMNTTTPDPRVVKMAKLVGFKVECEREKNYQWGGRVVKTYMMGLENKDRMED